MPRRGRCRCRRFTGEPANQVAGDGSRGRHHRSSSSNATCAGRQARPGRREAHASGASPNRARSRISSPRQKRLYMNVEGVPTQAWSKRSPYRRGPRRSSLLGSDFRASAAAAVAVESARPDTEHRLGAACFFLACLLAQARRGPGAAPTALQFTTATVSVWHGSKGALSVSDQRNQNQP